jgi:hypothetical protein
VVAPQAAVAAAPAPPSSSEAPPLPSSPSAVARTIQAAVASVTAAAAAEKGRWATALADRDDAWAAVQARRGMRGGEPLSSVSIVSYPRIIGPSAGGPRRVMGGCTSLCRSSSCGACRGGR